MKVCASRVKTCLRNPTKPKFHDFKKSFKIMKKMLIIVAVAFAAISCCGKCGEKKCCEQKCCQDSAAVEVVADSAAVVAEEAPAQAAE